MDKEVKKKKDRKEKDTDKEVTRTHVYFNVYFTVSSSEKERKINKKNQNAKWTIIYKYRSFRVSFGNKNKVCKLGGKAGILLALKGANARIFTQATALFLKNWWKECVC